MTRELSQKLEHVEKKHEEIEKKEKKQAEQMEVQPLDSAYNMMPTMG